MARFALTPKTTLVVAGALLALLGWQLLAGQPRQATTQARLLALDSCLVASNRQQELAAATSVHTIKHFVAENRYLASDMVVQRTALRIQARTEALLDSLHWRQRHWLAANTPAAQARLLSQLQQYTDTIREFVPTAAPLDQPSEALLHQDWLNQLDVAAAAQPVGVAALTRLEAKVRQLTADALQTQMERIGGRWNGFSRVGALAAPTTEIVAPGALYEAKLLLATVGTFHRITIEVHGQEVPTEPRAGLSMVTFRIPAAQPGQPDTVRAQWQGKIQLEYQLADTVLTTTVPYFIVKPTNPR